MSDLDLTVTITDGSLGLSDLALTRANGYLNPRRGISPGARVWRRQRAISPFIHGGVLVGQSLDLETVRVDLLVEGATDTELEDRMTALISRMEQPAFVLQVDIGAITYRWQCECADSTIGDESVFDMTRLVVHSQALRFLVPRQPVPLDGPL